MKRLTIFILIFAFVLTGCSNNSADTGTLKKLNNSISISITENSGSNLFNEKKEKPDNFEFEPIKDYYAGIEIPVPKDLKLNIISDNYYTLSKDGLLITISHKPTTYQTSKIDNLKGFLDSFDAEVNSDSINIDDLHNVKRNAYVNPTKSSVPFDSERVSLASREYSPMTFISSGDMYERSEYSEKRYYLRHNKVDTIISVIAEENEFFSNTFELADYIVYNLKDTDVTYDSVKEIQINENKKMNIPPDFDGIKIDSSEVGSPGFIYISPSNKHHVLSGCFVGIIKGNVELSKDNFDALFNSAFNSSFNNMYNFGSNPKSVLKGDSLTCTINSGNNKTNPKNNSSWVIERKEYKDGSSLSTVILAYPSAKAGQIEQFFK